MTESPPNSYYQVGETKMNFQKEIEELLNLLPQRTHVLFAIYCAESVVKNLCDKTRKPSLEAIAAAKAWLESPTEENRLKASSASYASYSSAAYSASSAAYSASSAAYSASSAAKDEKFKEQYDYLVSISGFTKLEKLIYNLTNL